MPKFFVKENQISNNKIEIVGDDVNHITNVLRMKQGEILKVCNQELILKKILLLVKYKKN